MYSQALPSTAELLSGRLKFGQTFRRRCGIYLPDDDKPMVSLNVDDKSKFARCQRKIPILGTSDNAANAAGVPSAVPANCLTHMLFRFLFEVRQVVHFSGMLLDDWQHLVFTRSLEAPLTVIPYIFAVKHLLSVAHRPSQAVSRQHSQMRP